MNRDFSFEKLQGLPSRKAWKANHLDTAGPVLNPVNKLISVVLVLLFFLQLKGLGVGRVNLNQNSKLLSRQDIAIRDRIAQSDLFLNNHLSQSSTGKHRPELKAFEKNTSTIHIIFAFKAVLGQELLLITQFMSNTDSPGLSGNPVALETVVQGMTHTAKWLLLIPLKGNASLSRVLNIQMPF